MEESLKQLLDEVRRMNLEISKLREMVDSQNKTIEELRNYISKNTVKNEKEDKVEDIVRGTETINPNEPKDIMVVKDNKPTLDSNYIYGDDKDYYINKMNKDIVDNYIDKYKAEEVKSDETKTEDNNYIPGTNFEKPRNRGIDETDEEYEGYLRKHYEKYFPESKELAVVNNELKELAVMSDVEKNDAVKSVEKALNNEFDDIFSDSSKLSNPIKNNGPEKKEEKKKNKSVKIKFNSEEEKAKFEKELNTDYKTDKNKKTTKIKKVRKGLKKFKEVLKKHGKKIIAGILVATAAISGAITLKACTYDQKDVDASIDNSKSNSIEYDSTIPSVKKADDISNGALNKDDIVSKVSNDDSTKNNSSNNEDTFKIGDKTAISGDSIYKTSKDAKEGTNRYTPYYSKTDDRQISAVEYVSPDGKQHMTALTKKDQEQLEKNGWKVESYNVRNNTHNTNHEGWVNINSVSKVK